MLSMLHPFSDLGNLDVRNGNGLVLEDKEGYKEIHIKKNNQNRYNNFLFHIRVTFQILPFFSNCVLQQGDYFFKFVASRSLNQYSAVAEGLLLQVFA